MNETEASYKDGMEAGLHIAHTLTAHTLDCPGAKRTGIVSETPEYKIGYVEALINAMTAISAKLDQLKHPSTESHDHDQQRSDQTAAEPSREP